MSSGSQLAFVAHFLSLERSCKDGFAVGILLAGSCCGLYDSMAFSVPGDKSPEII